MNRSRNRRTSIDSGAALIEMALSVPVLFLILSAVVEFGNVLSNLTWLGQSGYHLAAVAGESPRAAAQALVQTRLDQLTQAEEFERFRNRIEIIGVEPIQFLDGDRTAVVRVQTNLVPVINSSLRIPFTFEFTAAQLIPQSQIDSNYSTFGQPLPRFLSCGFSEITPDGSFNTDDCLAPCSPGSAMGDESCPNTP